jgi:hypothetical protein
VNTIFQLRTIEGGYFDISVLQKIYVPHNGQPAPKEQASPGYGWMSILYSVQIFPQKFAQCTIWTSNQRPALMGHGTFIFLGTLTPK